MKKSPVITDIERCIEESQTDLRRIEQEAYEAMKQVSLVYEKLTKARLTLARWEGALENAQRAAARGGN